MTLVDSTSAVVRRVGSACMMSLLINKKFVVECDVDQVNKKKQFLV